MLVFACGLLAGGCSEGAGPPSGPQITSPPTTATSTLQPTTTTEGRSSTVVATSDAGFRTAAGLACRTASRRLGMIIVARISAAPRARKSELRSRGRAAVLSLSRLSPPPNMSVTWRQIATDWVEASLWLIESGSARPSAPSKAFSDRLQSLAASAGLPSCAHAE